jgi:hypothetical protein
MNTSKLDQIEGIRQSILSLHKDIVCGKKKVPHGLIMNAIGYDHFRGPDSLAEGRTSYSATLLQALAEANFPPEVEYQVLETQIGEVYLNVTTIKVPPVDKGHLA